MSGKDLSWEMYDKNPGPGGAKVPDNYSKRDYHDATKDLKHPSEYLKNPKYQSLLSGKKK